MVFASAVGGVAVSNSEVFTPPMVPFRGDVASDDGGDLEAEFAVSVEYGDVVAFFSGMDPKVAADGVSPFCRYVPFWA